MVKAYIYLNLAPNRNSRISRDQVGYYLWGDLYYEFTKRTYISIYKRSYAYAKYRYISWTKGWKWENWLRVLRVFYITGVVNLLLLMEVNGQNS